MTTFEFDDHGALAALTADLTHASARAAARLGKLTRHYGVLLQTKAKANAAGRPGPRIQTSDYNRSISLRVVRDGASLSAVVGTNRPQGRRLELGFRGDDSLGRHYDQDPLPHFGPALDEIGPRYEQAIAELAGDLDGDAR